MERAVMASVRAGPLSTWSGVGSGMGSRSAQGRDRWRERGPAARASWDRGVSRGLAWPFRVNCICRQAVVPAWWCSQNRRKGTEKHMEESDVNVLILHSEDRDVNCGYQKQQQRLKRCLLLPGFKKERGGVDALNVRVSAPDS